MRTEDAGQGEAVRLLRLSLALVLAASYAAGDRLAHRPPPPTVVLRDGLPSWRPQPGGPSPVAIPTAAFARLVVRCWGFDGPFVPGPSREAPQPAAPSVPLESERLLSGAFCANGAVARISDLFDLRQPARVYATADLRVAAPRNVALLFRTDEQVAVWLNGDRVARLNGSTPTAIAARLRRGANRLVVGIDVPPRDETSAFGVEILPVEVARLSGLYEIEPLDQYLIPRAEPLRVRSAFFDDGTPVQIAMATLEGQVLTRQTCHGSSPCAISLRTLADGIYVCRLAGQQGVSLERAVFVGDVGNWRERLERHFDTLSMAPEVRDNVDALLWRWRELLKPVHLAPDDLAWQRKIVHLARELQTVTANLSAGRKAFVDVAGRHLRTFRSRIDGSRQHYMIYIPQHRSPGTPLPTILSVPFATNPNRPFLISQHVADPHTAEVALAERHGFAILWPGARGNSHGNPVGVADIMEALSAARADYALDPDRLYLYGTCAGARDALLLGERYPSLFAAIGVVSPVTGPGSIEPSRPEVFSREGSQWWLRANAPLEYVDNLQTIPVLVAHSDLEKTPMAEAERLLERCDSSGAECRLIASNQPLLRSRPEELLAQLYEFFAQKRRVERPARITVRSRQLKYAATHGLRILRLRTPLRPARCEAELVSRDRVAVRTENVAEYELDPRATGWPLASEILLASDNQPLRRTASRSLIRVNLDAAVPRQAGKPATPKTPRLEGPLLDVFAGPFTVVEPTLGPYSRRAHYHTWARRLCRIWEEVYFGSCTMLKDFELTRERTQGRSLILFGDAESNSVTAAALASLGLEIGAGRVRLGDTVQRGVGFELVLPSPFDPQRYVVLIGSTQPGKFEWPEANLPIEGWFDFLLWRERADGHFQIVDVGYFDQWWQRPISLLKRGRAGG